MYINKSLLSVAASSLLVVSSALLGSDKQAEDVILPLVEVKGGSGGSSSNIHNYYSKNSKSATRTDTPILETAQSVQIISTEMLDDVDALSIDDTIDYVSGVSRQNNFGGIWDNIAIRGFAGNENTGMSLLRNGMSDNRGFNPPRDMANVESIEFLKGPSGALYGNSEPGGTMNVVTKKPEFTSMNKFETLVGSENLFRVTADSTGPISDTFAYRLNLATQRADSFRDHVDSKRHLVAPAFFWAMSDNTSLAYDGEYIKHSVPLDRGIVAINEDVNAMDHDIFLGNPDDGDTTLENFTHQLKLEHYFSQNWQANASIAYKTGTMKGTASEIKPFVNVQEGDSIKLRTRERDYKSTDLSFQGDIVGNFEISKDIKNTLLVGVEAYSFEIDSIMYNLNDALEVDNILSSPTYTVLPTGKGTKATDRTEKQDGKALYIQDEIAFGKSLRLIGGIRYDEVDMKTTDHKNTKTDKQNDSAFSPKVGITYLIDKEWSVYATSGKSFRPNTGVDVNGDSFDPETGLSLETGVKYESLDKSIGATLALFQIDKDNVVSSDPSGDHSIATGEVRSKGLEFDINGKLTENIKVSANYAYTDTEVIKDDGGVTDYSTGDVVNIAGNQLLNIPKHSANLLAIWEENLKNNGKYGLGGAVTFVGKRAGNYINSFDLPNYTTVKIISYWKVKDDLTLKLNVNNIFDKKYIASSYDRSWLTPGAPRNFTFSMNYIF